MHHLPHCLLYQLGETCFIFFFFFYSQVIHNASRSLCFLLDYIRTYNIRVHSVELYFIFVLQLCPRGVGRFATRIRVPPMVIIKIIMNDDGYLLPSSFIIIFFFFLAIIYLILIPRATTVPRSRTEYGERARQCLRVHIAIVVVVVVVVVPQYDNSCGLNSKRHERACWRRLYENLGR